MMDERVEHLITRRLDGELTPDEELELNKALIRSPEARSLLAEYERANVLAAAALKAALGGPAVETARPWAEPHVRQHRGLRYVTGLAAVVGIAAVLVAVVGPLPRAVRSPDRTDPGAGFTRTDPLAKVGGMPSIDGPRHETQRTDRDVFGFYDQESQRLYLLEVDNTRSTIVPVKMNY